jgi:hypothetical protein
MKILKEQIGEIYKDGEKHPVFKTWWEKKSKDGKKTYYEAREVMFVNEVPDKPTQDKGEA